MDTGFYASNDRYTSERAFNRAIREGRLTEADRRLIVEYVREKESSDNITDVRAKKITAHLIGFRRFLPVEYASAGMADVYEAVAALKAGTSMRGRPFRQNTIHDFIRVLKPFLLWMIDEGHTTLPARKVAAIRSPSVDHKTTAPEDLLTIDDIEAMLRAVKTPRGRAIIATLYETAARVGELCSLCWGDVAFDRFGARVYIDDTKTEKRRYVRLTLAAPYLAEWKGAYPGVPDGRAPVFLERGNKPLSYIAITRVISRAAAAAGIAKRVHPHLFRKSRITHMIARNFQESVIKESCWGNQDTGMLRTYIQLRENDIDREFLRRAGVAVEDDGDARRLESPCPRCHSICGPTHDYCPRCAMPLSETACADAEAALESVLDNPDVLRRVLERRQAANRE